MVIDDAARALLKIGANVVNKRYVSCQMAGVAVPRNRFRVFLRLIDDLRPRPVPALGEKIDGKMKTTGEVFLDERKHGQNNLPSTVNRQDQIIRLAGG